RGRIRKGLRMFYEKELKAIEEAQQALIARSDAQRRLLTEDLACLDRRFFWLGFLQRKVSTNRLLLLPAAALAGFVAIKNWRSVIRWIPRGLTAWRFLKPLLRFR
ncbi:MAG TPA: hypothetical protein VN673_11565, partial [Clostridia bacterium]|nr:hypothetical protein [Clostridia bacterium]